MLAAFEIFYYLSIRRLFNCFVSNDNNNLPERQIEPQILNRRRSYQAFYQTRRIMVSTVTESLEAKTPKLRGYHYGGSSNMRIKKQV